MQSYKENSRLQFPSHSKSPYSRQNTTNLDPIVSKIISKPRTPENNYARSLMPVKPLCPRNSFPNSNAQFVSNYHEPSTSYASHNAFEHMSDLHESSNSYLQEKSIRTDYETGHFRPRKSHSGSRTFNNFGHSLEMRMSNVGVSCEVTDNPKTTKTTDTQEKSFQIKARQNQLRLFTGSVENLMHWSKLRSSLHILFEVTATVISIQPGNHDTEKCFWISDSKSGPKLQVVFYEIDRPLEKIVMGLMVTCIGRLVTRNRLQAYKVEESSEERKTDLERLSFICNRVADEFVSVSHKKDK